MWSMKIYFFCLLVSVLIWKFVLCNMPDYVIYYVKFGFYIMCTLIVSVLLLPYLALSPRNLRNGNLMARILQHVSKVIGVNWELRNGKVLSEERGAVVIANHQSSLDVLGLYTLCDVAPRMAPVCKKELLYLFPFGLAAYLNGCIFIDRRNPEAAHNTLRAAADVLFRNKVSRHAIIQCLEAVPTEGLTMDDLPELKDRVQKMMEDTYEKLGKEMATSIAAKN